MDVRVCTAQLPGADGLSEDRVFTVGRSVVVLDGVSLLSGQRNGWYPEELGTRMVDLLRSDPDAELPDVVATAIDHVATKHDLVPGQSPASTVAITRWTDDHIEGLVLGDSPIIVFGADGGIDILRDGRHDTVVAELRRQAMNRNNLPAAQNGDDIQRLITMTRPAKIARMNREGGYWIAEATPRAGHKAICRRWPLTDVRAVMAITDGVSCGIDDYAIPASWAEALHIALTDGLDELLATIHRAEAGDPTRQRWPRGKIHDDKVAALALFPDPKRRD